MSCSFLLGTLAYICSKIETSDLGSRKAGVLSGECDEPRAAKVELKLHARKYKHLP